MPITYKGAIATSASGAFITLPTHAVGDLIIIMPAANQASLIPTVPSAGGTVPTWTSFTTDNATGYRIAYTVATATNHTSGTWTNAYSMAAMVVSGHKATGTPLGGVAFSSATTGSTSTAPAITLTDSSGNSGIIHLYMVYSTSFPNYNAAPAGYTSRYSSASTSTAYGVRLLTKDVTTTDGAAAQTLTANATQHWNLSLEILAEPTAPKSGFFNFF